MRVRHTDLTHSQAMRLCVSKPVSKLLGVAGVVFLNLRGSARVSFAPPKEQLSFKVYVFTFSNPDTEEPALGSWGQRCQGLTGISPKAKSCSPLICIRC